MILLVISFIILIVLLAVYHIGFIGGKLYEKRNTRKRQKLVKNDLSVG